MDENIFSRVKVFMISQHYTFNESWLRECIKYCLETYSKIPVERIQSFAIEQWLLSNLREINNEKGCLPKNLIEQKVVILNGCYILQMEKMYDISTSKYKQLEKIRNVNVENLKATSKVEKDFTEPKSKRMFQLILTDGLQEIQAIEYKTIKLFDDTLLPGNKLKLVGPLTCRRGVILLEKENVFSLGGEIEDLLITNSLENILARSLNLQENPDPYNDTKKETESEKTDLDEEYLNDLEQLVRSQDSKDKKLSNLCLSNTLDFKCQKKSDTEKTLENQNLDDDLTDSELEALFNDPDLVSEFPPMKSIPAVTTSVEKTDNFKIPNTQVNQKFKNAENPRDKCQFKQSNQSNKNQVLENSSSSINEKSTRLWNFEFKKFPNYCAQSQFEIVENQKSENLQESQLSDDLILEDEDLIIVESYPDPILQKNNNSMDVDMNLKLEKNENNSNRDNEKVMNKFYNVDKLNYVDKSNVFKMNFEPGNKLKIDFDTNKQGTSSQTSTVNLKNLQKPKDSENVRFLNKNEFDKEDNNISKSFKSLFPKSSLQKMPSVLKIKTTDVNIDKEVIPKINVNLAPKQDLENERDEDLKMLNDNLDMRLQKLLNKSSNNLEEPLIGKKRSATMDPFLITHQNKIQRSSNSEEILQVGEKSEVAEKFPRICEFISDFIEEPITDKIVYKTITAQIKQMDKLSYKGGVWKLNCLISDGTENLRIEFSPEFIEKILGISALDFSTMKKKAKTDPKLELEMKQKMRTSQEKLEQTVWLMHLELMKNKTPSVVDAFELSKEATKSFQKKLRFLISQKIGKK